MEEAGLTSKDVKLLDVGHEIVPTLASGHADAAFDVLLDRSYSLAGAYDAAAFPRTTVDMKSRA